MGRRELAVGLEPGASMWCGEAGEENEEGSRFWAEHLGEQRCHWGDRMPGAGLN